LINAQHMRGASLSWSPRANGLAYSDRKVGLGETFFGVR
jgi:hypothetical protein